MSTTTLTSLPTPKLGAPGLIGWAERGLLPDALLRMGIRQLCRQRLLEELSGGPAAQARRQERLLADLRGSPIAVHTDAANSQHYELPPAFFRLCLGYRLKYSCAYYRRGDETLDEAEEAMLELYAHRAQLADGQDILELGCGWGSLSLWLAGAVPAGADLHRFKLRGAARAHRGAVPAARVQQPRGPHPRREPA